MQRGNWLKVYVIDVLPIITVSLYVLGVIYNIAYYSVYGINIIPYLTLGDMLMAIIEPLVLILLLTLFFLIATGFTRSVISSSLGKQNVAENVAKTKEQDKKDSVCNNNMKLLALVIFSIIISSILSWILSLLSISTDWGMSVAVLEVCFPLCIFFSPTGYYFKIIANSSKTELATSLFIYYLYCLAIFYYSGSNCAIYNKKIDDVKFDIETTKGVTYKDNHYGYIDQLGNSIFLYEKKTDRIIMLYTDNIMYTSIDFGSREKGLILSFMESYKEGWLWKYMNEEK